MPKTNQWLEVDKAGLAKVLAQRGKEFLLFELLSNAWDERVSIVFASLTRPEHGKSVLMVKDDSPEGWRNLRDAYVMFAESYKKGTAEKRGRFNSGEKNVLALCDKAYITTTTGTVTFHPDGTRTVSTRKKTPIGSEFAGQVPLTITEYEHIVKQAKLLIPPVDTIFNGEKLKRRKSLAYQMNAPLPTVMADSEGNLRHTTRQTTITVYDTLPGETAMLYEMGIPVVETGDRWHVDIAQKVPLNTDRDNVTPAFLAKVRVAVLNLMASQIEKADATANWVRAAAENPQCSNEAITRVLDLRFGAARVSYDPSDIGSNKEAVSAGHVVVSGGSLSAGEWENARRAEAITPAGSVFPTNHGTKTPDRVYSPSEYDSAMRDYAEEIKRLSPVLLGRAITPRFIHDVRMVHGCFDPIDGVMTVNMACHDCTDAESNYRLLLHEFAHHYVRSNDHLCREFYEAVTTLGARLAVYLQK